MAHYPIFYVFTFDGYYILVDVFGLCTAVGVDKISAVVGNVQRLFEALGVAGCAKGKFFIYAGLKRIVYNSVNCLFHYISPELVSSLKIMITQ